MTFPCRGSKRRKQKAAASKSRNKYKRPTSPGMFLPFAFKPPTAIGKGHGGLQNCKAAAWYVGKRIVGIGRHGETKNQ